MIRSSVPVVLILLFMLGISCSRGVKNDGQAAESPLPADSVIPEKKMISLLIDVHLLEAGINIQKNRGESDRDWNAEAYRKLFLRYRVSRSQFIRNMTWYQQDPKNFTRMYDTVLQRLDKMRGKKEVQD